MPIGLPRNYQNERVMYNSSRHHATMAQRIFSYIALFLRVDAYTIHRGMKAFSG
jgi:hypothetical protein